MTKISLDTNAYSHLMQGDPLVFQTIVESETVYISTIVIGELYAGFKGGNRYNKNIHQLESFLEKGEVHTLNVTISTSEIFGEIKSVLKAQGKRIPLNDLWIAAHAIETGSTLISFDSHFKEIPGLRIWEKLRTI